MMLQPVAPIVDNGTAQAIDHGTSVGINAAEPSKSMAIVDLSSYILSHN